MVVKTLVWDGMELGHPLEEDVGEDDEGEEDDGEDDENQIASDSEFPASFHRRVVLLTVLVFSFLVLTSSLSFLGRFSF